jgi:hypothetical protein
MRGRIRKATKERFRRRIIDVIDGLGRNVEVYKQPKLKECPNCYYDKLTDSSTNKCKWTVLEAEQKQADYEAAGGEGLRYKYFVAGRCPVCKGAGKLAEDRTVWIKCLVNWDPQDVGSSNNLTLTPAGSEGSTIVKLKTDPKYFKEFKNSSKIVVDGVNCKLSKAPIVRGLGNQAVLVVIAFTTDKPSIDTEEIIKDYS